MDRVTPGRRRRSVVALDGDRAFRPLDAVLLLGGAAVIIAGLTTLLPAWTIVAGIVVFVLGSVLPLRTFWRRTRAAAAPLDGDER